MRWTKDRTGQRESDELKDFAADNFQLIRPNI
jgi:hypothetical protein